MKKTYIVLGCAMLLVMTGCAQRQHFGVTDKAGWVPSEFSQTEKAIANSAKSPNAQYCPEKITTANQMGKEAAEIYWACQTDKAMALLADARALAKEAESCQPPARAVAPAPAPPPARVIPPPAKVTPPPPTRQPISFENQTPHFDFDKSALTPEGRANLDEAAGILRANPDVMLEIQGNTDSVGNADYNKALGERRAQAAADYLKSRGIASSRLRLVSYGENKPVATNATAAGRAQNRRVDLIVVK